MEHNFNTFIRTLYRAPRTRIEQIRSEHNGSSTEMERAEVIDGNGIHIYFKGHPHPTKSCPTPEAMEAMNICKKIFVVFLKTPPIYSPKRVVASINHLAWWVSSPYILKWEYMLPISKEVYKFVYVLLTQLGISDNQSDMLALTIAHIIEYDAAYRYRLQDFFAHAKRTDLISYRALRRLARLIQLKDKAPRVGAQSKKILYISSWIVYVPFLRRAIKRAVASLDWDNLLPDDADRYWMSMRTDYDFNEKTK